MKKINLEFTGERLIPKVNVGRAFYYEHLTRYLFASQIVKDKTVLDLGCGSGYGSFILKNTGHAKKVIGIDISSDAINYAKENYDDNDINFRIGDIRKLNSIKNNSIDIVVSFEVLEHIREQGKMLSEVKRILKKNGLLIISTPNILTYPKGNKYHLKELSPKNFEKLLKKHFKNINIFSQNFFFSEEITNLNYQKPINILTSENIFQANTEHFTTKKNIENSEYLLTICSNFNIPKISNLSLSTDQVDTFSLKQGILSLSNQFSKMLNENQQLLKKINLIEDDRLHHHLKTIRSSKIYRLWQKIRRLKQKILIHQKNYGN